MQTSDKRFKTHVKGNLFYGPSEGVRRVQDSWGIKRRKGKKEVWCTHLFFIFVHAWFSPMSSCDRL